MHMMTLHIVVQFGVQHDSVDIPNEVVPLTKERKITFWMTLDKPMLVIVGVLLAVGLMMVYSTTFNWSQSQWGTQTVLLMRHVQNMVIGLVAMAGLCSRCWIIESCADLQSLLC